MTDMKRQRYWKKTKVDVSSADYRAMIERSLMQLGDTRRIKNMIERAKAGKM